MDQEQVIELNVGGKLLTTHYFTLMKESPTRLSKMFENLEMIPRDKQCRFVIDFDGDIFVHVLNYLRTGSHPPKDKVLQVYNCAEYFGIQSMVDALRLYQPVVRKNEITELKKSFDNDQYEVFKQHAVETLNGMFHPGEDNFFVFVTSHNYCSQIYQNNGKTYVHSFSSHSQCLNVKPLFLHIEKFGSGILLSSITEEPKVIRCLGYDLCELGFGNIPYYSSTQLKCNHCGPFQANILYLRQKLLQERDKYENNWKSWITLQRL